MAGKAHSSRNHLLAGGISRYSRSAMYRKKALYKKKKVVIKPTKDKEPHYKIKPVKGEKNGQKRVVLLKKPPRYYPTEDAPRKLRSRKNPKAPRLRHSITPGTVLILLAGRHQGKRVVFLKQLSSGLLLVTGPFTVNGVPLRRVCQAYVIATKTKVELGNLSLPDRLTDDYFRRSAPQKKKVDSSEIFSDSKQHYSLSDQRKEDQKAVDSQLLPAIKATPSLRQYLAAKFSLHKGQYPHAMVF